MPYIGLTGGLASGKSTVSGRLAELGARLVDLDLISRQVVEPGQAAWSRIRERFGPEAVLPDQSLNRDALRKIIFENPAEREALNQIIHPAIFRAMDRAKEECFKEDPAALVVVDAPLLIELNSQDRFDCIILVYVPYETQVARLMARDGYERAEAAQALAAQMSLEEKRKYADILVDNRGTVAETMALVDRLYPQLMAFQGGC